jgi:hypothetical protein
MTTRSGRQYTPYCLVVPIVPMAPPKWAPEELFDPLDLANIKGGLHDLPKDVDSWIPKFSGEGGASGNTHWTKFCESYDFHQSGKEHPDTFMKLFFASLTGDARKWSTNFPSKILTTCEDLEQVFLQRWGVMEDMASLYSNISKFANKTTKLLGNLMTDLIPYLVELILTFYQRALFSDSTSILSKETSNPSSGIDSLQTSRRHKMVLAGLKKISNGVIPFPRSILLQDQDDILWFNEEDVEEEEHDFPEILEVNDEIKLAIPPKGTGTWKNGFSNMKDALIFSKQHEPSRGSRYL